jgi:hypothetical protein
MVFYSIGNPFAFAVKKRLRGLTLTLTQREHPACMHNNFQRLSLLFEADVREQENF